MWKQLAPCVDALTIAAASMSSRTVKSLCVSANGLLIVPFVGVDSEHDAGQSIKSLHAIDKGEVVELSVSEGISLKRPDPDFFTLCLGWLLGAFRKLRRLDVSAWRGNWDSSQYSSLWMTVLRNLQRHCHALEALHFYGCPEPAVKVLPTFTNLLELSLSVHPTSAWSVALLLDRLADCASSLCRLHAVRFEMLCGMEDCTSSLQRCMDAFPLKHVWIVDDALDDALAKVLSRIRWPSSCCMLGLSAAFPGEGLCALAEQVCRSCACGLFLEHVEFHDSLALTALHVQKFLATLQWSWLQDFYWAPPTKLPSADVQSVWDSLCTLVDNLCSLRLLHVQKADNEGDPSEDLANVAWKWGVALSYQSRLSSKVPVCVGCCDCEFNSGGLV